eukprot:352178-Chlamydomonas_euryale.AAC.17
MASFCSARNSSTKRSMSGCSLSRSPNSSRKYTPSKQQPAGSGAKRLSFAIAARSLAVMESGARRGTGAAAAAAPRPAPWSSFLSSSGRRPEPSSVSTPPGSALGGSAGAPAASCMPASAHSRLRRPYDRDANSSAGEPPAAAPATTPAAATRRWAAAAASSDSGTRSADAVGSPADASAATTPAAVDLMR